jgi:alcohol dehydrogenase (cytochrome c)
MITFARTSAGILAAVACIGLPALAGRAQTPQQAPPPPMPKILQQYNPVMPDDLLKPGPGDWRMARRTYDGWGYSPLEQLTPGNVARLQPVWVMSTGVTSGHQAPPLLHDGVMFVATPSSQVLAIDARTGVLLWRYRYRVPEDAVLIHQTSRGVALWGDRVFLAAGNAVLVAINARTGQEVWTAKVAENKSGYYMSLAPLVANGKVIVGTSGSDRGIRGFLAAFDVETGKEEWRVHTVPAPGEPGSETWPEGDAWKTGGAGIWVAGNYDPETRLSYWGTANAYPWIGDLRPGDNLYTSSTVAIDVTTGQIKGHHQYHPNDSWDWDEVSPPILVDFKRQNRSVKGLVNAARNGYLWFLERTDGPIKFVDAQPFVKQNVFKSIDPKTGRPEIDPAHKPRSGETIPFCPSIWGGKNWPPAAFSPKTRMIYIPANENLCSTVNGAKEVKGGRSTLVLAPGADHIGEVQAWNVDTNTRVWTHKYASSPNWGAMLATGGGLVFTGGTNDRKFHALDASSGKLLWEYPTSSGILAPPVSYMLDGKQYIAVLSGWGVDSRVMQQRLNLLSPGNFPEVPEGGAIWVFSLPSN